MLPILRIIPVGGVLLAIAILVLALNPPGGPHVHFTSAMAPPRGALIAREEHPEWPGFLLLAALRRATELNKLRDLPDSPARVAPVVGGDVVQPAPQPKPDTSQDAGKIAGVPPEQGNRDDDVTGTVQSPNAAIPVDIGETSSTELPVIPQQERPPVIMMPAREPPRDEDKAAPEPPQPTPETEAPATAKQASREVIPQPAKPKQEDAAPAKPKQAMREAVPEPAKPKPETGAAVRAPAQHEVRRKKLARRAHRIKTAEQAEFQFNLFQPFFDSAALPPGKIRPRRTQ